MPDNAASALSQTITLGKYKIPVALVVVAGAALLAVISLNSKKSGSGTVPASPTGLIGQYDPSVVDSSVSAKSGTSDVTTVPASPLGTSLPTQRFPVAPVQVSQDSAPLRPISLPLVAPSTGIRATFDPTSGPAGQVSTNNLQTYLQRIGVNTIFPTPVGGQPYPTPAPIYATNVSFGNNVYQAPTTETADTVLFSPDGVIGHQISIARSQLPSNAEVNGGIGGVATA